jgi:hypothetical protein
VRGAFGQHGVLLLAVLVGATDIDPFVINIAQGGATGLAAAPLAAAVLIAAAANNLAKAVYCRAFAAGGRRGARALTSSSSPSPALLQRRPICAERGLPRFPLWGGGQSAPFWP